MHFHFRNVNEAFDRLVNGIALKSIPTVELPSRNGPVLKVTEPVLVSYTHPLQRVLFNSERDANPFFHLFESLWMLSGSNKVQPLAYYNSNIGNYSDDGEKFHGAYGHRWRVAFGMDQLLRIADALEADPDCRRQVLSIWSPTKDLGTDSKDLPCNINVYFSVRHQEIDVTVWKSYLDMTVCNRSNDLVWGMLGANVVHYSYLLEYMAKRIGVEVGTYHHMTNNLHVYKDKGEPKKWASNFSMDYQKQWELIPLVDNPDVFDMEVIRFVSRGIDQEFTEPFLRNVAQPMCGAYRAHKQRRYYGDNNALTLMSRVHAPDWKEAGTAWIEKRKEAWEHKSKVAPSGNQSDG